MSDMEYRSLGRTGVKVSKLCLGCMNLGTRISQEESMNLIDKALDEGINFLDTANVYGRGVSEEAVGAALKRNGKRERVVLATKVFGVMADGDPNASGSSRRHIFINVKNHYEGFRPIISIFTKYMCPMQRYL